MGDRALVDGDRGPDVVGVPTLLGQQGLQVLVAHAERARQGLVGEGVGDVGLDTRRGAAADDRDRGGRRDRQLVGKPLVEPVIGRVRARPALGGERPRRRVGMAPDMAEYVAVPCLRRGRFDRHALALQEGVEAHHAEAHRTLSPGGVFGPRHAVGRLLDEILEHVVEEAHHVLDEERIAAPFEIGLEVERGQAADRGPLLAVMVGPGRQGDLAAQVRHPDLEPGELVMLGRRAVHMVDEDEIGLAGLDPAGQQPDPQRTRLDAADNRLVLGADERPFLVVLDRAHEGVGDDHAVMQIQRLAVGVAAGRAADLDELLDLGVVDADIDRRGAAPERALRNRQRERVHHPDEGDDARGLAVGADLLADRAEVAPVAADAAAARGEPHVLVPQVDDAVEAVRRLVEEARDRQAAIGAAVRQHRRRRHEPEPGHVVVEPLRVRGIVAVIRADPGEKILVPLVRQQIAVVENRLAELGQQGIPVAVDLDRALALGLKQIMLGRNQI